MPKPKSKRPNPTVLKLRKNILVLLDQIHSLESDVAQARAAQGYAERGWRAATEELSACRLEVADFHSSTELRQENTRLRELLFERFLERASNALRAAEAKGGDAPSANEARSNPAATSEPLAAGEKRYRPIDRDIDVRQEGDEFFLEFYNAWVPIAITDPDSPWQRGYSYRRPLP